MMRALLILACVLVLGCQARETNKALQQADQAAEGSQRVLAERVAPVVAKLPPELQTEVRAALDQAVALLTSCRTSIRPALALTANGEPPPPVDTTVEEAVARPQVFISKAAMQTGRAAVEVERIGWWLSVGVVVLQFGQAVAGDMLSQILLLVGGSTGTAAVLAKGIQLWRTAKQATQEAKGLQVAVADAVAFGNDMSQADSDTQAAAVITAHRTRQERNGTRKAIKDAGAAAKAIGAGVGQA